MILVNKWECIMQTRVSRWEEEWEINLIKWSIKVISGASQDKLTWILRMGWRKCTTFYSTMKTHEIRNDANTWFWHRTFVKLWPGNTKLDGQIYDFWQHCKNARFDPCYAVFWVKMKVVNENGNIKSTVRLRVTQRA